MWGRCEPVPSPDWIAFEKLPPSRWGETTIILLLSLPLVYLGVGVAHAWAIVGVSVVGALLGTAAQRGGALLLKRNRYRHVPDAAGT